MELCFPVVESFLRHRELRDRIESERENEDKRKRDLYSREADELKNLIPHIDGENYKETCARLSFALGEKINSTVFHMAVKKIRKRL